nr:GGDEF domain-containing protein [Candidatus Pantoea persica]
MKLQSYDELKHSKYRLSLMLFLFLNVAVSFFCLLPFTGSPGTELSIPVISVALFSATALITSLIRPKLKLPLLNPVALLLGAL